jgi:hypothetical protein
MIALRFCVYAVGMFILNAPRWVYCKFTGKTFVAIGGPQ